MNSVFTWATTAAMALKIAGEITGDTSDASAAKWRAHPMGIHCNTESMLSPFLIGLA